MTDGDGLCDEKNLIIACHGVDLGDTGINSSPGIGTSSHKKLLEEMQNFELAAPINCSHSG